MDAQGLNVGAGWVVAGLGWLVLRLIGRVETHEAKINQLCEKAKIDPIKRPAGETN